MTVVDLRSDTVTQPSPAMRDAMARASVGDDVYGEDPTVRRLEEETAELLGKEASLFVPSGTMANQIALSLLARPGTEVVIEQGAHVLNYEAGAAAAIWGITLRTIPGSRGTVTPAQIQEQLRPANEHVAPVRAVAIENTHNRAGGSVWSPDALDAVYRFAQQESLGVHVDGARLWNASCALDMPPVDLVRGADTVSVCFSKGLGAPVGSAIASTTENIAKARFQRKRLGGGMRQVGILAAGALHALHENRARVSKDHRRAARLSEALEPLSGVSVLPVETNIVIADIGGTGKSPSDVLPGLSAKNVLAGDVGGNRIRFVTHLDIDDDGLERAISAVTEVLGGRQ